MQNIPLILKHNWGGRLMKWCAFYPRFLHTIYNLLSSVLCHWHSRKEPLNWKSLSTKVSQCNVTIFVPWPNHGCKSYLQKISFLSEACSNVKHFWFNHILMIQFYAGATVLISSPTYMFCETNHLDWKGQKVSKREWMISTMLMLHGLLKFGKKSTCGVFKRNILLQKKNILQIIRKFQIEEKICNSTFHQKAISHKFLLEPFALYLWPSAWGKLLNNLS